LRDPNHDVSMLRIDDKTPAERDGPTVSAND
jgi:hypothetical protein